MIKLIATDMDGTLLNNNKEISKENIEAIIECQKQGIKVALASGRGAQNLFKFADILKINDYNGYLIGNNGQEIFSYKDFSITKGNKIPKEVCHQAMEIFRKYKVYVYGFNDDVKYGYLKDDYGILRENSKTTLLENGYNEEKQFFENEGDFDKFGCYTQDEDVYEIYNEIKSKIDGAYNLFIVNSGVVELVGEGIDKVHGIKELQKIMGLEDDEILVFGDGLNDLNMLKKFHGVAMSNALDELKMEVKHIVDNSQHIGVANGINKFVWKR
jgi:hypothetical protein